MRFAPLLFVLLIACPEPEPEPPIRTGGSLFAEGCPEPGRSLARVIGVDDTLPGEAAVGTAGDLLLANEHAAFVITDTGYCFGRYAELRRDFGKCLIFDFLAKPDVFNTQFCHAGCHCCAVAAGNDRNLNAGLHELLDAIAVVDMENFSFMTLCIVV